MRRPHLNLLLIGGIVLALALGIVAGRYAYQADTQFENAMVLPQGRAIDDFALTTARNTPYTPETIRGRHQLLFFGFTHCPDVCPTTLALLRQVKAQLELPQSVVLDYVFVSVDPERDTLETLDKYVHYFDPEFVAVRGEQPQLQPFAQSLGMAYLKSGDGPDYQVDHTTALVLLDDTGRVKAYFPAPHSVDALVSDLSQLLVNHS